MITGYLITKAVFVVDVDRRSSIHKSVYTFGCIFGERIARILFQVMKEGWVEPQTGFPKHFAIGSEKRKVEVVAFSVQTDYGSG